eukprot:s442_g6.t1
MLAYRCEVNVPLPARKSMTCSDAGRPWPLLLALVEDMELCRVLPSATTHNVIIGALGSQRETSRALDLFHTLSSFEQEPDAITYTQAFKAHEAASQWAPPLTLLNKMCTAGTTPNVVTYGAVLSANAAVEEDTDQVRKAWIRSLSCCTSMAAQGVEANIVIFSTLLSSCGKGYRWAQSLHHAERMGSCSVRANARMCSALLTSCLAGAQWRWALWLWSSTWVKADVIMYNNAIAACQCASTPARALSLLSRMKDKSLQPNTSSCNAVLACCEASWEQCLALLEEMKSRGPAPDAISFSCCLRSCAQHEQDDEVRLLLSEMRQATVQLDVIACSATISQRAGSWEWALGVCASVMPSAGLSPNAVTVSSATSAFEKAGRWQWALRFVDSAEQAFGVSPGLEACNAALSACERSGRWTICLAIFTEMKRTGPAPDEISYNAVIHSCSSGPAEIAVELFQEMESNALHPDIVTLSAMMSVYQDKRSWHDVYQSLAEIETIALYRRLRQSIALKRGLIALLYDRRMWSGVLLEHPRFVAAKPRVKDAFGDTALHRAASFGHVDVRRRARLPAVLVGAGVALLAFGRLTGPSFACAEPSAARRIPSRALTGGPELLRLGRARGGERLRSRVAAADEDSPGTDVKTIDGKKEASSKTEMLRFALPALGIYLANPIMSNIDNSFVGHFGGTTALAALSPGGVLADNLFFLFNSVLSAATTGLVARAWPKGAANAREELIRTFSFALACGVPLSLFYWFCSNWVLGLMGVPQNLHAMAASYARIRGLVSWASLGQGVCLSAILATRDAVTPLRVVVVAALLNVLGDFLLCCWPLRTGVSGAAAATAISTMCGFALMMRSLQRKQILPTFRRGALRDAGPVLEYAGPMLVINMTRIAGFTAMAFAAAATGTRALAAYQVILGIFVLFAFIGAPLSQTAQTMLPPLIESSNTSGARKVAKNVLTIGAIVSIVASVLCYTALMLGAGTFTSDPAVLGEIHGAAFMVCLATGTLLISSSVDGALLAAKDFGFIVTQQVSVVMLQLLVLRTVLHLKLGLPGIWMTLAVRVILFVPIALTWLGMGYGPLGRVLCAVLLAHPRFGKLSSKDVQGRTPLERALAELRSRPGQGRGVEGSSPREVQSHRSGARTARLLAILRRGATALEAEEPPSLDEEQAEAKDAAAVAEDPAMPPPELGLHQATWASPLSVLAEPAPSRRPELVADRRAPDFLAISPRDLHGVLQEPAGTMPEIRAAEPGKLEFLPPRRSREKGEGTGERAPNWEAPWSRGAPELQGLPESRGEEDSRSSFPSAPEERLPMEAPFRNRASGGSIGLISPQRHRQQLQEEEVRLPEALLNPSPTRVQLTTEDASSRDPTSAFEGVPTEAPTITGRQGPPSKLPKPIPVQQSPALPPSPAQQSQAPSRDALPAPVPVVPGPQEPDRSVETALAPPLPRDAEVDHHLSQLVEESEPSMAKDGHASLDMPKLPQQTGHRDAEKQAGVSLIQDAAIATESKGSELLSASQPSGDFASGPRTVPGDTNAKGRAIVGSEVVEEQLLQGGAVSSVQSRTLGTDIPVQEEVPCLPDDAGRQGNMAEAVGTSAELVEDVPGAKGLQRPTPADFTKLSQTDIPTPLSLPPTTATDSASSSRPEATEHRHTAEPMQGFVTEPKPQASHPEGVTPSQTSTSEAAGPPITTDGMHASTEGLGPKPSNVLEKSRARPATAGDGALPTSSADTAAMVRTEATSSAVAPAPPAPDDSTQELLRQLRQQQAVLQRQVERLTRERDRERSPRFRAVAVAEDPHWSATPTEPLQAAASAGPEAQSSSAPATEPGLPSSSPKRSAPTQVALRPSSASRVLQRRTPLHIAAKTGRLEVCLALLDEGLVDVNAQDMHGFTCFHYACKGGHFQICAALLAHPPFEALATLEALGCNALHCAAAAGHGEICQLILSHATEVAMHGTFHALVQQSNIWGQVPFDVATGSARYVFLTKGLGRGLFKEEPKERSLLLGGISLHRLSRLRLRLPFEDALQTLGSRLVDQASAMPRRIRHSCGKVGSSIAVVCFPGALSLAILFLEYDGYYTHQLPLVPSGIQADERKNAALLHYAAGSQVVRVAHAGRNAVEAIVAKLKPTVEWLHEVGFSNQVSKAIARCPRLRGYSSEANLKPTVEWLHEIGLSKAQANLKPTVEWLHEVGLSKAQVSKAIATYPALLGCSIETNLKPTVEWLHEVGLSKAQVSKAIATFPKLLCYSIAANLKPTVKWLHEVGLSEAEVSTVLASHPRVLGYSIEKNLSPKLSLLQRYYTADSIRDMIAVFPALLAYSHARLENRLLILYGCGQLSRLFTAISLTQVRFGQRFPA